MPAPLKGSFAERVVHWQRRHGRHGLPWQGTRDPYRIWLSEIMLQQTQVSTVLRYYDAFLQRFPTVADLAAAPQDDVLAAWSGLGYYSRARNLHRCAQAVVREHGGVFPRRAAELEQLPGIGRSTAAAVAAFSAGERAAILDGNVKRVLARHLGVRDDLSKPAAQRQLWSVAESLLPEQGIEAYTQGLMDLGATVCLPRSPNCLLCPVQTDCVASCSGRPQDYPVKSPRAQRGARRSVVLIWLRSASGQAGGSTASPKPHSEVLLCRRPPRGIWAGLWAPLLWNDEADLEAALAEASRSLGLALEGPAGDIQRMTPVVHALTHLDWTLVPMRWSGDWANAMPGALPGALSGALPGALSGALPGALVGALAARAEGAEPETAAWFALADALKLGLPAPIRRWLEDELAHHGA